MFVSEKVVYLELHKTGCTHIRNLLGSLLSGRLIGKHNQAGSNLFDRERSFLGSVRDPWEWYTSLWAYGCDRRGVVYKQVTQNRVRFKGIGLRSHPLIAFPTFLSTLPKDTERWKRTYRDVDDAEAFREWLRMVHSKEYWYDFGEGYGLFPLSEVAGLLTYRYVKLFCTRRHETRRMRSLSTFDQLADYERENCFIDYFIRNEHLESDLFAALEHSGIEVSAEKKAEILSCGRTNTSSRRHGPRYYYDPATEDLIAEREKLIIEKFGYAPPSLRD